MATNNKLIYTYAHGAKAISPELLSSYSDSLVLDEDKRTLWFRGHQYGNSYYGSNYGENFNDFKNNNASGNYSHAEGTYTTASAKAAHAEGQYATASGVASNASGSYTVASGLASHSEGSSAYATGVASHAEGLSTYATGVASHAEGAYTVASSLQSHAEGLSTYAVGDASHAEGELTYAIGSASHAEGKSSYSSGKHSHAEGELTYAIGEKSHAEGLSTYAVGDASHSEGRLTYTIGDASHAEGLSACASGSASHAEGELTYAIGNASHAEGLSTYATGKHSHAEGIASYAIGAGSFASGIGTQAYNTAEAAFGSYNKSTSNTVFTIGDGTSYESRHNIIEVGSNATYVSSPAYFGGQVIGSLTYSYIDALGPVVTLQELLLSTITQPEYTKPVVYTKFMANESAIVEDYQASYDNTPTYVIMDAGHKFHPGVMTWWPTTAEDTEIATRSSYSYISDYGDVAPQFLGYSYGLNGNDNTIWYRYAKDDDYDYNELNSIAYGNNADNYNIKALGSTYLKAIGDYHVIGDMHLSYMQSSYQVVPGLWEQGNVMFAYGRGDNSYFGAGIIDIPANLWVKARRSYYIGFSTHIPTTYTDMTTGSISMKKGWLHEDLMSFVSIADYDVRKDDASGNVFFICIPEGYSIASNDGKKVKVTQTDGIEFDLSTDIQPLVKGSLMMITFGQQTIPYRLYYIDFKQSPLGIYGSNISLSIANGDAPVPEDNGYLLTEIGWPVGTEDGLSIRTDVWGEPVNPDPDMFMTTENDVLGIGDVSYVSIENNTLLRMDNNY